MKKIFLIPLLACFSCVMAWGATISVGEGGTYPATDAGLNQAIAAASAGDVIELTSDIAYATNGTGLINITKSITLDGQGHKIVGWGTCNSNHGGDAYYIITPLAINYGEEASNLDVTLKNISMSTVSNTKTKHEVGLTVMDKVAKLTLKDCDIRSHTVSGAANSYGIAFYGETTDALVVDVENSFVSAGASGYAFTVLKPIDADLLSSTLEGYSSVTFYAPNAYLYAAYKTAKAFGMNNSGSRGTTFYAKSCDFNAPNIHSGVSNAYATFAIQDDGINLTLDNCGIDATQLGDQHQWGVMLSPWTPVERRSEDVNITFTGDNSHINGILQYVRWFEVQSDKTNNPAMSDFAGETWAYWSENGVSIPNVKHEGREFTYTANINITISGGTYAQNVGDMSFPIHVNTSNPDYSTKFYDGDNSASHPEWFVMKDVVIPDGYEVKTITMEGVATPLYRVVKKAKEKTPGVKYDLNDLVTGEGVAEGNNPVSSFDLSTGSEMTLNQETTTAGYVEVKDNGSNGTTVTVGKDSGTDKDQKLIINNGLDVQGNSKVEVKAGSTLEIGEGGIVTEKPENIVIDADENGAASLIMDPTITVNQTPNLTVKMKAKSIGWMMNGASAKEYYWHRFALPIQQASTWVKNPNKSTYVFGWNYSNDSWEQLSALTQMVPFKGYTLSADYEGLGDVEYTFTGQLAGNTNNILEFERNGFNFFGNSYTGYIDILALVEQIMGDNKIDGSVWVWGDDQNYHVVPLLTLRDGGDVCATEIAPMQTFILKQNGSENASAELNYASAVWGNPRYGHSVTPAPSRNIADETTRMRIIVTAENGKSDFVMFTEDAKFSDSFEKGYDGEKYMNENALNMFATVNGANYTAIATDNLEGKMITINTVEAVNYTMSFAKVNGEEYAIRDNATGKIIAIQEGATYEFAAQPNSTVEGRFQIVMRDKVTTAIENTEVKANVKGIYTLMGQYVGEDFNTLPAGVYVVDGVKIVK